MTRPRQIIPFDRLPPGFVDTIDENAGTPAVPRSASTVVLMRESKGIEILLLRRSRSAGFVPGAYVFPGGRVDTADGRVELLTRIQGLDPGRAGSRLGLDEDADPSPTAYWITAIREAFEETGLLPGPEPGAPPAVRSPAVEAVRDALMTHSIEWGEAMERLDLDLDLGSMEYIAHWITPVAEPRRYDTRFFVAEVGPDSEPVVDPREMVEAVWLTPAQALKRHEKGSLPMVFPTLSTITELSRFGRCEEVLEHYREREIPAILPRLVRTPTGVGLQVDPPEG
jgi:8-oxo-dGTP pyrophosphatase MutT (NUDIX family)